MTSRFVNPKRKQTRLRPAHLAVASLAALIAAGDQAGAGSGWSERSVEVTQRRRSDHGHRCAPQIDPSAPSPPRTVAHQARRAGRRSHTAGSGGLRQASRSFISSSSSRSHLRTASIRSTSVGAAGRLFDCHAISATSLRLSTGSPLFQVGGRATWQNRLKRSLLSQIAPLLRRAAKRGHIKNPVQSGGNGRGARYRAKPYRRISNQGPGGAYAAAKTNFSTEKGLWSNFRPDCNPI